MKKYTLILVFFLSYQTNLLAQNKTSVDFENGLLLSLNDGKYSFQFGGFIQPSFIFESINGESPNLYMNAKRAFLQMGGKAVEEKVSFFIQTNFSETRPLYDAWVAYHPSEKLTFTFGQKQNVANNREMLYREDRLQFTERSDLSTQLSVTGREFGIFVEGKYGSKIGWMPMGAITSGDGRNSFGVDSRDVDLGGLKYAGRLDVYPLGFFTKGNELFSSDLMHEPKPKLVIGTAGSINQGATNAVGEGHGDFLLYNENGKMALPNYRQLYADILAKYKGFSVLLEFGNASASGLEQNFSDEKAILRLAPGQISSFMRLGNSFNSQFGYVTKNGYSFDVRYGQSLPEFALYTGNLLATNENITLGFTRFFKGHNSKIQSSLSRVNGLQYLTFALL
jgi:hypothetical protein